MGSVETKMIYFETDRGVLHQGHVIDILQEMEPECVHCGITSPPYWGLRVYSIEVQVYDGDPDCEHLWNIKPIEARTGTGGNWQQANNGPGLQMGKDQTRFKGDCREANKCEAKIIETGFCQHCNAWRGSLGLEPTVELYLSHIVQVFREVKRVLHKSGCIWVNMGDSYAGSGCGGGGNTEGFRDSAYLGSGGQKTTPPGLKPKDLCGIPWRVALALQADGWYLRSALPWVKRSAMPESCTDRPANALEYMFLLSKSQHYFFDMDAVRVGDQVYTRKAGGYNQDGQKRPDGTQPFKGKGGFADSDITTVGRNYRNTDLFYESIEPPHGMIFCGDEPVGLDVNPQAMKEAHFATFPEKLVEPCLKAGTSEKGCCPECLAPWERIVEKSKEYHRKPGYKANSPMAQNKDNMTNFYPDMYNTISKTIGWKPSCKCILDPYGMPPSPIPCTVLDPFFGSGTVAVVAEKHRRNWIGIELSTDYCELAKDRIQQATKQKRLF